MVAPSGELILRRPVLVAAAVGAAELEEEIVELHSGHTACREGAPSIQEEGQVGVAQATQTVEGSGLVEAGLLENVVEQLAPALGVRRA